MTPETNIRNAVGDLWVEKFPEGDTTSFPKGLIKRISMEALKYKGSIVSGQYSSRISILWYETNSINFDTKMASIITAVDGIKSDSKIYHISYEGRDDGYDDTTDMHVMNLDFVIKHTI